MALLPGEHNPFGGVVVDPTLLPRDTATFTQDLEESLASWNESGVRVVWLQLPLELSAHVPIAVDLGFTYHHATTASLQLVRVLVPDSYVPPFATHYIGAGGVVLDDSRQLLVIQERHHRRRHLKLPGGALHPREHIADAVVREVKEETGIDTEFLHVVCMRHWHGYRHGKSDIYFVTRLRPLSSEITIDPVEIADCQWMNVDSYLTSPDTHEFNRRIVQAALDLDASLASGGTVLAHGTIPDYGTEQSHELFFPDR